MLATCAVGGPTPAWPTATFVELRREVRLQTTWLSFSFSIMHRDSRPFLDDVG
jgi:hypothetical protein